MNGFAIPVIYLLALLTVSVLHTLSDADNVRKPPSYGSTVVRTIVNGLAVLVSAFLWGNSAAQAPELLSTFMLIVPAYFALMALLPLYEAGRRRRIGLDCSLFVALFKAGILALVCQLAISATL